MHTLSLNELTQTVREQRLAQMENIFLFPTADPSTFPETHGQEFIQQIQHLPSGRIILSLISLATLTAVSVFYFSIHSPTMSESLAFERLS